MDTVFAGGPGVVAFGTGVWGPPAEWTSSDGITWRRIRGSVPSIHAVVPVPGGFEAVGERGIWTSADGETWTLDPRTSFSTWFGDIASGPRGLVAIGGLRDRPGNVIWIRGADKARLGPATARSPG